MLTNLVLSRFLDELALKLSCSWCGSVAALAGAGRAALTSMVCNLTIGKKKYARCGRGDEGGAGAKRAPAPRLTALIDKDTERPMQ